MRSTFLTVSGAKDCPCVKAPTPESTAAKKARRACSRGDEGRRLVLQELAAAPAVLGQGALGLGDAGQHLARVPAEASLHDLLHAPPEVGRRLVVVLARAGDVRAAHQVPIDQSADVDRDVALALLELGRDLLEREGPRLEVEEREDSPLELAQDARGRGRRSDAFDEDPGRAVHADALYVAWV